MSIRFKPNHMKLLEALVWVTDKQPQKDFHFIVKVLFYADKYHLEKYGRPVTGDSYIKMRYGPVASIAFDLLKSKHDFLPDELFEKSKKAFTVSGNPPTATALRKADRMYFSDTDLECLEKAYNFCKDQNFNELVKITHKEKSWKEAHENMTMDFELFIDENVENREEIIQYLRENSAWLAV